MERCLPKAAPGTNAPDPKDDPCSPVLGFGFSFQGSGRRVYGLEFGVWAEGFRVSGLRFRVEGLEFRIQGLCFLVSGFEFLVWSLGFRRSDKTASATHINNTARV